MGVSKRCQLDGEFPASMQDAAQDPTPNGTSAPTAAPSTTPYTPDLTPTPVPRAGHAHAHARKLRNVPRSMHTVARHARPGKGSGRRARADPTVGATVRL